MHDGPEGAFALDMAHITFHFVKRAQNRVDLPILNDRIANFEYKMQDFSNGPPPISDAELSKKSLTMSDSEMMSYIFSFPFLFGDLTSHDEVWQFYLTLLKVVDLVMALGLQSECADLLEVLIAEHHSKYFKFFGETLKPRHHHMVHYGKVLRTSGPSHALSAFKFE